MKLLFHWCKSISIMISTNILHSKLILKHLFSVIVIRRPSRLLWTFFRIIIKLRDWFILFYWTFHWRVGSWLIFLIISFIYLLHCRSFKLWTKLNFATNSKFVFAFNFLQLIYFLLFDDLFLNFLFPKHIFFLQFFFFHILLLLLLLHLNLQFFSIWHFLVVLLCLLFKR